jgi:nucleoside-diphosphate-sugar epimerase
MRALVTGGGGFLGAALVRALAGRGDQVRVLARGDYPELAALGAEMHAGDIRDLARVAAAARGVDVVFHAAAKAGGWGDKREFEATNVHGTENVIAACRSEKVGALVYTSSPSVVHAHHDIEGGDESLPYAEHFTADYPRTKAIAEKKVREAASPELRVVALRPHFIWGPGDRHLLPRLVARAKVGRLRQIGARDVLTDTIYIDNCVDAHLLAADALRTAGTACPASGNAYFVSDGSPIGLWTMANRMLAAVDGGQVGRPLPAGLAYAIGATLEGIHALFGIEREPLLTRFAASELSHAQWFDISAARRDLRYAPRVSIEEGMTRMARAHAARAT